MRGKIDLTGHKMAGLFRPLRQKGYARPRYRGEKMPDAVYRQLVRLIDGAVRDTFDKHPEYLTDAGEMSARRSIVKRAVGALWGYAKEVTEDNSFTAQAVQSRSDVVTDALRASAAEQGTTLVQNVSPWAWPLRPWLRSAIRPVPVALGGGCEAAPADNLAQRIRDTQSAMKAVDHG